jgi:carbon starvation protein CstA
MFEALFVLTTIDTGTRIARFLVQEFGGRLPKAPALHRSPAAAWCGTALACLGCVIGLAATVPLNEAKATLIPGALGIPGLLAAVAGFVVVALHSRIGSTDWLPGTLSASVLVVAGWSYFIYTGTIQTLWPMFGVANQLLAIVALAIGTTVIINEGRSRYAWVTLVPLVFVGVTTLSGGYFSIRDIFLKDPDPWKRGLNSGLTAIMMVCVVLILFDAVPRWLRHWKAGRDETKEAMRLPSAADTREPVLEPSL